MKLGEERGPGTGKRARRKWGKSPITSCPAADQCISTVEKLAKDGGWSAHDIMRSIGSFDAIAETFYQSVQEYEGDSCEVVSTASTWVLHRECQEGYEKLQQLVRVQNNCKTVPRFRHVAFPWKCGRFCCALTL